METQPRSLNTLYKLLWEQIKQNKIRSLFHNTSVLEFNNIISRDEMNSLELHIIVNRKYKEISEEFVQRKIKETEKQ